MSCNREIRKLKIYIYFKKNLKKMGEKEKERIVRVAYESFQRDRWLVEMDPHKRIHNK